MQLLDTEAQIHLRKLSARSHFPPNAFPNVFKSNYKAEPLATPSQTN